MAAPLIQQGMTMPQTATTALPKRSLSILLLAGLLALAPSVQAGLFDVLKDIKGAIDKGDAKADAQRDKDYEAELARKFPPYKFGDSAQSQSGQYVEVLRGGNFKDIKKVGIVNFSVEFALFKEVSASGGSNYQDGTARAAQKRMKIPAPQVAELQAMVDRLYRQTEQDFAALGIEVVPFATLKASKHFAELAPAQHDSPWLTDTKDSQSVFIAPTGMPLYLDNPERADFLKGLGMTFGTNTRMKEVMMTYDLNQEVQRRLIRRVVRRAWVFPRRSARGAQSVRHPGRGERYPVRSRIPE
jgi:hypothetical protein